MHKVLRVGGLVFILILVGLPGGALARNPGVVHLSEIESWGWHSEVLDSTGNVGEYTAITLDSNGRPRISYYGSSDLKYAYYDGTSWQVQVVDAAGDVGLFSDIAGYAMGLAGISYYDATNGDLKYWDGSSVTVDTAGNVGQYTSLAFDNANFPRISYYDAGSGNLKYAYRDGSGWHVLTLDSTGDVGRYSSLAVRSDNNWHSVTYYDVTNGELKYYWYDAGGNNIEIVDSGASAGQWTSLDLDSSYWPHVSYIAGGGQNLKYAYKNALGWHFTVVDTDTSGHTALQLDTANHPHITYWKNGALHYAYFDGTDWHYETVDAAGDVGAYNSLVLDSNDRPLISYRDDTNMDLKYAYLCCAASFTLAPQPQCMTQPVQFTDQTFGFGPFTYLWTFGDGGTSSQQNPAYSYAAGGVYTAWMTATAGCGADAVSATVVISSTPTAGFTYAPTPICAGTTIVQFTNTTVTSPTTTYQWAFDDGYFSTLEHPTHTYAAPALYDVTLIATNGCGIDVATVAVQAHGAPVTDFSWQPSPPEIHQPVTFTAAASSTLPVDSYLWDFGDGFLDSGAVVAHTYADAGEYTVTLVASSACGTDALSQTVAVVCYEPISPSIAWDPPAPTIGFPTAFSAQAGGSEPMTYTWSFGDGGMGEGQVVSHTYEATGTYMVDVTATNECGAAYSSTEVVVVALPSASFQAGSPVCLGEGMVFTNTSGGAEPLSYLWTFGDGDTTTKTHPVHLYAAGGPYTVQLTVSNAFGSDSMASTVEVWAAPTSTSFVFAPDYPAPGAVVTFTASAEGGYPAPTFHWGFGDGEWAFGQVVTHTYWPTGTYTVLLEAGGVCGVISTTQNVQVAFCTQPTGLNMTHSAPLLARELATFTATLAAGSAPLTYAWDFGDSTAPIYGPQVVSHTFALAGVYTVNVAAWNGCGTAGPLPFVVEVEQATYYVYLPIVFKGYYSGDQYEPDNTSAQASLLPLATPQTHNFAPVNDVDWVYLNITAAGNYHIRTFNLGGGLDTRLFLYDAGGNLVTSNDDCPGGQPPDNLASCVTVALTAGRYNVKVDESPGTPGGMRWGPTIVYTLEATQQ